MLIISRKKSESIRVDGPAELHLIQVKGGRVKIGIDAPESTTVSRPECVRHDGETVTAPELAGVS